MIARATLIFLFSVVVFSVASTGPLLAATCLEASQKPTAEISSIDVETCDHELSRSSGDADLLLATARIHNAVGDREGARAYLQKASAAGSVDAELASGALLLSGNGGAGDDAEAAKLFRNAADQGSAGGMLALAGLYSTGRGVEKDPSEAARWTQEAANKGNGEARYRLGMMYLNGEGEPVSLLDATDWFRFARQAGVKDASFWMAIAALRALDMSKHDPSVYLSSSYEAKLNQEVKLGMEEAASYGNPTAIAYLQNKEAAAAAERQQLASTVSGIIDWMLENARRNKDAAPTQDLAPTYQEKSLCDAGLEAYAWSGDATFANGWC